MATSNPGMYDSLDVYHRTRFGVIQSLELFRRGFNQTSETGVSVPVVNTQVELAQLLKRLFFVESVYLAGGDGVIVWMSIEHPISVGDNYELFREEDSSPVIPTTITIADEIMMNHVPKMLSDVNRIVRADYHDAGKYTSYIIYVDRPSQ